MSKGSTPSQTTTTTSPPAYTLPYYKNDASSGANLYENNAPLYYPGNQVAPFSPLQEQGFSQIQGAASQPNTIGQTGQGYFNNLESGSLLNPATNPALQGVAQLSDQQIQNNLDSQFAGSGRNIEASAPIQANQMGTVASQIYGGAYNNTLNNMTGALSQASPLTNQQYISGNQLLGSGSQIQGQAQNMIGANQNAFGYYQYLPYQQLSGMNSLLTGIPGGSSTQPYYTNKTAGALGGAAAGATAGSAFGPWGTVAGGALGALMGY